MTTRTLAILALLLVAACGGAEASAPAKSAAPPPPVAEETSEPRTIEEAEAQIARLSSELGRTAALAPPPPAAGSSAAPKPSSAPGADATKADDRFSVDACQSPCRALASMRRAVDALCRMTGDADARCVDAKKTLADSITRTASCRCG